MAFFPTYRSRCIWSKLKCDYHQNCGAAHDSDESGCGYFPGNSIYDRLTPWSVSTMSLLIIVYLAIVLILVLVTMLLLRYNFLALLGKGALFVAPYWTYRLFYPTH